MTAPLSLPPACELWIDGVRFADGQPGEPDTEPVALTDLRITWGRSNTLDQPQPATCNFSVLDVPGGRRFPEVLHIGSRVEIRAQATIYPDPTISTIPVLIPGPVTNAVVTGSGTVTNVVTGAPETDGQAVLVMYPPAAYSSNPSAWDAVPRTLAGQTWRLKATVALPAAFLGWSGWAGEIRPVAFTSPAGPGTVLPDVAAFGSAVDFTFVPPTGVWLGLQVRIWPVGPAWDDLNAGAWDSLAAAPSWDELSRFVVSGVQMLAPAAGAGRSGSVFHGRITDLESRYALDLGASLVEVIAQDDLGELDNRYVGDTPWPAEGLAARFGHIVAASGQAVQYTVDAGVAGVPVSYRDVDAQPTGRLLAELAQSVAGVLWAASSLVSGPYLRLEDVNARPALMVLQADGAGIVHIVIAPVIGSKGITLDACSVLMEPVRWVQDSQDSSTRVALTWLEQTTDAGVIKPTQRTLTAIDPVLETASGQRRVGVSTQLMTQADAQTYADALLARLSQPGWRVSGLLLDLAGEVLDAEMLSAVMQILDGTTRLGLPIMLTGLPEWTPTVGVTQVPLFLEGGRFTNLDGMWRLELLTSSAAAQGTPDVAWNQLDAGWMWNQFDPAIAWSDLAGVGP